MDINCSGWVRRIGFAGIGRYSLPSIDSRASLPRSSFRATGNDGALASECEQYGKVRGRATELLASGQQSKGFLQNNDSRQVVHAVGKTISTFDDLDCRLKGAELVTSTGLQSEIFILKSAIASPSTFSFPVPCGPVLVA